MKRVALTLLISLLINQTMWGQSPDELTVLPYWKYYNTQAGAMYGHLCQQAFHQLSERKKAVGLVRDSQTWLKRQAIVRQKLQQAVGTFPQKTPLNPVVTGRLERNGFIVEKLYYESVPNYYVTAALFMPADKRKNLPAILFCSGHNGPAFRSGVYQQMILNYVKKGFAVLAFDPIGQGERVQYAKATGQRFSSLKPTLEHSYPGAQSFVAGVTPARYFIWDGIRAIDYLLTRPEIDPERIGITGRSGGGTQSAYLAALDPRIQVAALECYLTTYDKLLRSNGPQDAEQILPGMLAQGLDLGDLVEVRAPRPTLMVTTTRDMFSIDGAREVFGEAKRAFKALGNEGNLAKTEDDAGHESTPKNRQATYAFFQKYLRNPGSSQDEQLPLFDEQELQVTPTGNVVTSLASETLYSLTRKNALVVTSGKSVTKTSHDLKARVMALTGYVKPMPGEVLYSGKYSHQGYDLERYLVKGPGAYYLPVLWFKPQKSTGKIVLYIDSKGKAEAANKGGTAEQLIQAGYHVVLADLSGAGELADAALPGGDSQIDSTSLNLWFAGILTRKSLVAVRMEEIQILTEFIQKKANVTSISAMGVGTFIPDVLHSALLNPAIDRLVLVNGLATYRSLIEQEYYLPRYVPSVVAGAINTYDLPDLVAALAPRKVWMANLVNGAGHLIQAAELEQLYSNNRHITVGREMGTLLGWFGSKN